MVWQSDGLEQEVGDTSEMAVFKCDPWIKLSHKRILGWCLSVKLSLDKNGDRMSDSRM